MDVEVELALEVMGPEFAKTRIWQISFGASQTTALPRGAGQDTLLCFIPCHNVGDSYPIHARKEGEKGKNKRGDYEFVLVENLEKGLLRLLERPWH